MQGDGVSSTVIGSILCVGTARVVEIQAVEIIRMGTLAPHGEPWDEGVHAGRDKINP
jgi:hypothetical protein